MPKSLLILSHEDRVFSFLVESGEVQKIKLDKRDIPRITDSIFKGRVKRLAKGMDGVFVDVGLEKEAYLPLRGGCRKEEETKEILRVGDEVIVQVQREPIGEKGAKLTTRIKLIGKYTIYLPTEKGIKFSSKISENERERLKEVLSCVTELEGGLILRKHSVEASKEELIKDIQNLRKLWENILKSGTKQKKPGIVLEEYPFYVRLIRDYWYELEEVVVDEPKVWGEIIHFLEEFEPSLVKRTLYVKDVSNYLHRYNIHDTLRKMLSKYVWLRSGGYLVIEETEAMTVIDVNSGEPCGESHEENALSTNIEAAKEIARQIILRDIGGIIVIDFIDMKKQENREAVIKVFQEALGDDMCNVQIFGFTKLGLLEIARRKSGESVPSVLSEECPLCKGKGKVMSKTLFAFELEKELRKEQHGTVYIYVHPQAVELVKDILKKNGFKYASIVADAGLDYNEYYIKYGV